MAKKFGKFLLCTAAIGTAAAAAYYYFRKKDSDPSTLCEGDEDYDDFSSDSMEDADLSSRSYFPLGRDAQNESGDQDISSAPAASDSHADADPSSFTPLTEQMKQTAEEGTREAVEEFFDEDDAPEEEPPIPDN